MMTRTRMLAAASLSALTAPAFADTGAQTRSDGPDEVIVVTSTALALGSGRRRPYLLVGWLWYLGMMKR